VIVSEIGIDMSRFPTEGHLIFWAGLCPGTTKALENAVPHALVTGH
jgi:transposase